MAAMVRAVGISGDKTALPWIRNHVRRGLSAGENFSVPARLYVLPRMRRLTPDVHSRVARMDRAEPHIKKDIRSS